MPARIRNCWAVVRCSRMRTCLRSSSNPISWPATIHTDAMACVCSTTGLCSGGGAATKRKTRLNDIVPRFKELLTFAGKRIRRFTASNYRFSCAAYYLLACTDPFCDTACANIDDAMPVARCAAFCYWRAPTCRDVCGHGGIGRRATLRSLWAKARGSSSLLGRTRSF